MIIIYLWLYAAFFIVLFVFGWSHRAYFYHIKKKYKLEYRNDLGIAFTFAPSKKVIEFAIQDYQGQSAEPSLRRMLRNERYYTISIRLFYVLTFVLFIWVIIISLGQDT